MQEILREAAQHAHATGKPFLLVANKQDVPHAINSVEVLDALCLHELPTGPCRGVSSSLPDGGKLTDARDLSAGISWLISTVREQYTSLQTRVETQVAQRTEAEQKAKAERKARLAAKRAAREAEEAAAAAAEQAQSNGDATAVSP